MAEQLVKLEPSRVELLMLLTDAYEPLESKMRDMSTHIDSIHYVSAEE